MQLRRRLMRAAILHWALLKSPRFITAKPGRVRAAACRFSRGYGAAQAGSNATSRPSRGTGEASGPKRRGGTRANLRRSRRLLAGNGRRAHSGYECLPEGVVRVPRRSEEIAKVFSGSCGVSLRRPKADAAMRSTPRHDEESRSGVRQMWSVSGCKRPQERTGGVICGAQLVSRACFNSRNAKSVSAPQLDATCRQSAAPRGGERLAREPSAARTFAPPRAAFAVTAAETARRFTEERSTHLAQYGVALRRPLPLPTRSGLTQL